ncbi:MAG: hypothetical protein M1839_004883 [Geoglossum umbratile]|nr:MAG: hypothetical protein M1839_004883 [Geoglossum umbratile]
MASSEANPKDTSTPSTPRARHPFGLDIYSGLDDDPAVSSTSDSLQIGPKGESSFPHLSELSLGRTTPKAASPSPGPHGSREDQHFLVGEYAVYRQPNCSQGIQFPAEYPASSNFGDSIPQIPLPTADIQENRPAPCAPPRSPDLLASLQIPTPKGSTGNEEEFEMVDEIWDKTTNMYKIAVSPGSTKFPFSVNRRFGKPNTEPKYSINIKSGGLRAIVLQALEDGNNASACTFGEGGITVGSEDLLNCLPQLEDRLAFYTGFTLAPPTELADAPGEHLKRLVKFLKPLREINIPPTTHSGEVDILSLMPQAEVAFEDTAGKL